MKSISFGLLALLAVFGIAFAGGTDVLIARMGSNQVTITLDACTTKAGAFADMPEDLRSEFMAAKILWDGKNYAACWKALDAATVYLVDETGDAGAIPASVFKKPDVI